MSRRKNILRVERRTPVLHFPPPPVKNAVHSEPNVPDESRRWRFFFTVGALKVQVDIQVASPYVGRTREGLKNTVTITVFFLSRSHTFLTLIMQVICQTTPVFTTTTFLNCYSAREQLFRDGDGARSSVVIPPYGVGTE